MATLSEVQPSIDNPSETERIGRSESPELAMPNRSFAALAEKERNDATSVEVP